MGIKSNKTKAIISIAIKAVILLSVFLGIVICFIKEKDTSLGGKELPLFFTIQSNVWIAICSIILAILQLFNFKKEKYFLSHKAYLVQQIFTVSITLTGIVYCCVLLPSFAVDPTSFNPFGIEQILLHVVVPILSALDFTLFVKDEEFKTKECLWATIPVFYYLGFSLLGYFLNWDFGKGHNYPYFFLNYDSPAGVFGFSNHMPYFMGSFYWIILLAGLVVAISFIYIFAIRKLSSKSKS